MVDIAEIVPGEFPIDGWHPILLEILDGESKASMGGRFPGLLRPSMNHLKRDGSRVINLPIYENKKGHAPGTLRRVMDHNDFPDEVPAIIVANRYDGYYCDERRAQSASVFPVWADGTSMLLELDWSEGPLEDCSNPEWHVRTSPRVSIKDGADRLMRVCHNPPMWEACSFYLYVIPPFLGSYILGQSNSNSSKVWQKAWRYSNHAEMLKALDKIITTIVELEIDETN